MQSLQQDGLVEQALPLLVVPEDVLDDPVAEWKESYSVSYLLFSVSILTFFSVMNSFKVCTLFRFTFTFSFPAVRLWKSYWSRFFLE